MNVCVKLTTVRLRVTADFQVSFGSQAGRRRRRQLPQTGSAGGEYRAGVQLEGDTVCGGQSALAMPHIRVATHCYSLLLTITTVNGKLYTSSSETLPGELTVKDHAVILLKFLLILQEAQLCAAL